MIKRSQHYTQAHSCYFCKKETKPGDVFIGEYTENKTIPPYQYFCRSCWLEVAGEEFVFESESK